MNELKSTQKERHRKQIDQEKKVTNLIIDGAPLLTNSKIEPSEFKSVSNKTRQTSFRSR